MKAKTEHLRSLQRQREEEEAREVSKSLRTRQQIVCFSALPANRASDQTLPPLLHFRVPLSWIVVGIVIPAFPLIFPLLSCCNFSAFPCFGLFLPSAPAVGSWKNNEQIRSSVVHFTHYLSQQNQEARRRASELRAERERRSAERRAAELAQTLVTAAADAKVVGLEGGRESRTAPNNKDSGGGRRSRKVCQGGGSRGKQAEDKTTRRRKCKGAYVCTLRVSTCFRACLTLENNLVS